MDFSEWSNRKKKKWDEARKAAQEAKKKKADTSKKTTETKPTFSDWSNKKNGVSDDIAPVKTKASVSPILQYHMSHGANIANVPHTKESQFRESGNIFFEAYNRESDLRRSTNAEIRNNRLKRYASSPMGNIAPLYTDKIAPLLLKDTADKKKDAAKGKETEKTEVTQEGKILPSTDSRDKYQQMLRLNNEEIFRRRYGGYGLLDKSNKKEEETEDEKPSASEEKERTWFQKSAAYDDGYQMWDFSKAVGGTVVDVAENITEGILGIGENALDAVMYMGAKPFEGTSAGERIFVKDGKPQTYFDWQMDLIKKDLVNEEKIAQAIVLGSAESSVLGEKTDSVVQSGGQLLGTVALQAVGVPWFLTTGVTAFGGEVETALNEGASYGEAGASAAIKAGAEILTEKLSGGIKFGGKTLDDVLLKPLTEKITNKAVKTMVNFGIDAVGEGGEEVVSSVLGKFGDALYKEESLDELLTNEAAFDEYLESFIGGAVLGGFGSVSQSVRGGKGIELTEDEQKVVDFELERRIGDKPLTDKQKENIRSEVVRDMQLGYISTDTIEEVLGGEAYETYKHTAASEVALRDEYNALYKMKNGEKSDEQIDRQAELKKQLDDLKTNSKLPSMREQLSGNVMELVKGSRLMESYNERGRRGQAFQADLSKYDAKQQAVIQKAMDSGILNNTNRTHEFVDLVARISADKGVPFDFTNNERLKKSGFALEGKTVNGFVTKDGVTLNIDSAKALNRVVGHEITHVLEGTELYKELQTAVAEYAKKIGEYDTRLADLTNLYKNVKGADVSKELTADLVGDYLFTDTEFVRNLSVQHRNVFQKIFDEIKYLYKIATAGSAEARKLEAVKKAFEDAYRETKNTTKAGGVDYSITEQFVDKEGNTYNSAVLLDTDVFDGISPKNWGGVLKEHLENRIDSSPFIMPVTDENGNIQNLEFAKPKERVSKNGGNPHPVLGELYTTKDNISKLSAIHIDEIVEVSNEDIPYHTGADGHGWLDANGWLHRTAHVINSKNGNIYQITMDIAKARDGRFILYALNGKTKKVGNAEVNSLKIRGSSQNSNFGDNVAQNKPTVKVDYSISDSDGRQLTTEQQEFFKDSKVRDKDGNLLVMYHGTQKGGFTVFKNSRRPQTEGFYFTNDKKYSYTFEGRKANGQLYPSTKEGIEAGYYNPQRYKVYLDVKNPLVLTADQQDIIEDIGYWEHIYKPIKEAGYDGVMMEDMSQVFVFKPNQIKAVTNENPTDNPDIHRSLSNVGETPKAYGNYNVYGKDIALEAAPVRETAPVVEEAAAPVRETVAKNATVAEPMFPDDLAPVEQELDLLIQEQEDLEERLQEMVDSGNFSGEEWDSINAKWQEVTDRIAALEDEAAEADDGRLNSLGDADAPPVQEAPYSNAPSEGVQNPFDDRDYADVGNRKVKAYMYENPEVKPFFQEAAGWMLGDLYGSQKGEKWYNDKLYYETGGEKGWGGTKRHTTDDIADLLDSGYTYAQIEKGLNAIIEDNGAENNAVSKRIEFALNDRLLNGFRDIDGRPIPADEEYIRLIQEKQINEYSTEAFDALMANADRYAPPAKEDVAPVLKKAAPLPKSAGSLAAVAPVAETHEAIRPKPHREPRMAKATPAEQASAQVLVDEPKVDKKKPKAWNLFKDNVVDKGTVFEKMSLKTGNRELQAKFKAIGRAESSAQWFMEHGDASTKSLKEIMDKVEKSGKTQKFYEYLYHMHNVDRMSLVERKLDVEDKPVFGYGVTSEMSKAEAAKLLKANPEFKQWAESVYSYHRSLRQAMVDGGVISQETADRWEEKYPHYVPVRRKGDEGLNINVALDTKRTGINAPVKRATGGNRDILPLFDTMALRTEQTFKSIAKNRFGVELKNMLGSEIETGDVSVDEAIDSVEMQDSLLQEGKDGMNPTFTVFENGERVTFEITEEMYDTMKPKGKGMAYTNKVLNKANDTRRGLLTEYNPAFMLTNPIKDMQDVLMNSQHPAKTYANFPKAIAELWGKKGQYYQEYMEHGGEQNTYFDGEKKTFVKEKSGLSKVIGFPLEKISQANNFIERIPRMAEYIASRKAGRSIDVAMLDAARVTTDFSAGGDVVKVLNRNGFTFLNASVQGAVQQVRNIREAKAQGLKGWAKLAGKTIAAGLPAMLLNHLLWDDDEDYAELSDYVKENYYIVAKYGDGKFVRIPKGRALAVIQNAFEQMGNLITGNDEADFEAFAELAISNLAPNNPLENNLIAPIMQAWNNTTWYGDDLVPSRMQDLPAAEQYDETTDSISKWLGEKLNISPYKINYVLDQYSGAVGDMFLPMMTPEAERGNDSWGADLIAPISDKFTTDSVLKNQNVSDFYTKKEELTVNANASGATDEDVLRSKYMNSVNADLANLYAAKREIQNSTDLSDAEKYEAVRDIQKQIDALTKEALGSYDDITFEDDYREGGEYARVSGKLYKRNKDGEWDKLSDEQATKYEVTKAAGDASYATDGTNHYRWYVPGEDADKDAKPGWRKVTEKELERQEEVTSGLGISPETYWNNRDEYSYAYDNPENYAVAKAVGGYESYKGYSSDLYDIKADKDKYGKSISGSRKEKVLDYINGLDADYHTKIILWKSEYPSDDTYNDEIIDYINGRDDLTFEEKVAALRKIGFDVTDDGDISW